MLHSFGFFQCGINIDRKMQILVVISIKKNILRKADGNKDMDKIYYQAIGYFKLTFLFLFSTIRMKTFFHSKIFQMCSWHLGILGISFFI